MKAPFEKTWWVHDGVLLAGCYPGDLDNAKATVKLHLLLDSGVRCFVSLQEPGESSGSGSFNPYVPLVADLAKVKGIKVECLNFPIRDNGVPTASEMRDILDTVRKVVQSGRCVYVHCWGGHGRTGTVVGCWLREHGLSGKEALARITELRRHDAYLSGMESPQTHAQRELILNWTPNQDDVRLARAQGCLLGQLTGDALGSLVEFRSANEILRKYPSGVRELADGGTHNTIAGQPTDDSEMALLLARMLADRKTYDAEAARTAYIFWRNSGPFDCGRTISDALRGHKRPDSEANGAMMRISPLGIFGANHDLRRVAEWARQDAFITHPNPVCLETNALFAMAIADAIQNGPSAFTLYDRIVAWAKEMKVTDSVMDTVTGAAESLPADFMDQQGWVLIAFRNALWRLLHAPSLEEGVVDTVMQGGDTDTNAAICGALLGAVHGKDAIPQHWVKSVLSCRPEAGRPNVRRPRPECFWPVDALELTERLLFASTSTDAIRTT